MQVGSIDGIDDPIRVDAGGWGLTWAGDANLRLRQIGLGSHGHLAGLDAATHLYPDAHPVMGAADPLRPVALRVTHCDGTLTTRVALDGIERHDEVGGEHVVLHCADEVFEFRVEHHLRTHPSSGVLEQWIEIEHDEQGAVRLVEYDSIAALLLVDSAAEICHFGGSGWADEWRWSTCGLTPGTLSLASLGGVQPHLQRSPCLLLSPSGPSGEHRGEVLGLSIAWGGNTRFELDLRPNADPTRRSELRLRAGANPVGADYLLEPGTRFVTPKVAWTWSDVGRGEVTRRFHDWTRARVLRNPERLRPLVVNNWEATFFDFGESRILDLIERTAALGADVFVLDDGWFGATHPRTDDAAGLGDWEPDPVRLPGGLAPLAAAAHDRGIGFGIWVEPEMVNAVSDLYQAHPDWVLRDRREPREHRNQFLLDPLPAAVREFELGVLDRTLALHPGITYVKWDANRPVTDPGSPALGPDRQSNVWVDQVLATWQVMDEAIRRHPDVELMLCASGGGRTDHATLSRFHEFWTSDNTDPVTRVRMQWACSHFFPPAAMAAHATRWGDRPLGFACAVALSARFGFDLDLAALTAEELSVCRHAVDVARRTQDLVQRGELVRLISPVEGTDRSRAAFAYFGESRTRAVLFVYQLEAPASPVPTIVLEGLDETRTYRVTVTDLDSTDLDAAGSDVDERAGSELAHGLPWPLQHELTARIVEITALN